MNLLLDTNIILNIVRAKDYNGIINFINPDNSNLYISVVSEAEIKSLALRNKWGIKRSELLDDFLEEVNIIEVNQLSVSIYTQIDAYSQRLNPDFENYQFDTPRNMGKNDLWIASLAALLGLRLLTTDSDFDHLNDVFFEVKKLSYSDFQSYF